MTAPSRRTVIAGLGVTQILAWGSSYYLLAVLAAPVVADTGWPLSWVTGSLSGGLLVAALVLPRVGAFIGLHGGRMVLAASSVLFAAGLVVIGLAPSLPIFVAGWLLIGAGMGAGLYDAAFATLGTIYGRDARSAITALTLYGGFASTVCWPLSALLVEQAGWRGACFAYAAIQVGVSLPVILLTIPRSGGALVAQSAAGSEAPALRTAPIAAALAVAITVSAVISSMVAVQLLVLLQATGASLAAAVSLGALMGPAQVGARLVEMAFGARYHPLWTLLSGALLMAAGLGLFASGWPLAGLAVVVYGGGNGVWSIARGAVPLALFGPARYAAIMGRLARPALIASAAAPLGGGLLFERGGADLSLAVLSGLAAANVAVVATLAILARRQIARGGE